MFRFILACLFLIQEQSWALQASLNALARSYPFSGNLEAQVKEDYLIWDKKQDSKVLFGYLQPRALASVAGTAELGLNFYPISLLELSASSGATSRYYKLKKFDCDLQICNGLVRRDKLGIKALLGKESPWGAFVLMPAFQVVNARHSDDSRPLADEQEHIISKNGGETTEISTFMAGLKVEDEFFGYVHRYSFMKDSHNSSEADYLFYRFKMNQLNYMVGAGQYISDLNSRGFSAIFSIQWQDGTSIGFF